MASIQTALQITDRVSAPLNSIITALDRTCSAFERAGQSADRCIDANTFNEARTALSAAQQQVDNLGNEMNDLGNSTNVASNNVGNLTRKVMALAGAWLSVKTAQSAMDMSDTLVTTTARLNMMNDGLQTTDELVKMVYQSAQDARGSFVDMAAVVAKFGNNAKDAFSSSKEVVQFANLIQKQMTIAGASTAEASNAMLQLSQALGSGVLRGDELNSIFEQAPNLIQSIADYLDVPIGQIRSMAQEGQLSADIVKNAIFASADDINSKFSQIPMTWNQVWTSMKNSAIMRMQPVLDKINEIANNQQFQNFANSAIDAFAMIGVALLNIMNLSGSVANFISENWSIIAPIIYGVVAAMTAYAIVCGIVTAVQGTMAAVKGVLAAAAAMAAGATFMETVAQQGLNAALWACPITWIIALIIALIAVIYAVCAAIAKFTGVANSGFGVVCGAINVAIQFFKNLGLTVANIAIGIWNALNAVASNMVTAFQNAIANVKAFFYDLLSAAMSVISKIANALNKLPFVEIDVSGLTSAADSYAAKAQAARDSKGEYQSLGEAFSKGMGTFNTFEKGWAKSAFDSGAAWGDSKMDALSNMVSGFTKGFEAPGGDTSWLNAGGDYDSNHAGSNLSKIAGDTGKISDKVTASEEDLKYLRDIAERDFINRFTTAEIKVEMTNNNNVSNEMDLDGMVNYLTNAVNDAMEVAAEGVHV